MITKIITWILANWKTTLTALALIGLAIFYLWVWEAATDKCESVTLTRTITKTIEVQKEHEKIRNHKLTTNGVIASLQNGSF